MKDIVMVFFDGPEIVASRSNHSAYVFFSNNTLTNDAMKRFLAMRLVALVFSFTFIVC